MNRVLSHLVAPTLILLAMPGFIHAAEGADPHLDKTTVAPNKAAPADDKETAEHKEKEEKDAQEKGAKEKDEGEGKSAQVTLTPDVVKRFEITTYHVEPRVLREPIVAPGTVAFVPETTVHIGSVVLGRVSSIHAHLGDTVQVGDPLITIDSPELGVAQNEWLQKRAGIAVAQVDLNISEKAHQRTQELTKVQGVSLSEAQRREGDFLKAQVSLLAAKASAQAAENTLRMLGMDQATLDDRAKTGMASTQIVIRSATAGTVIQSSVTLGEVARPETESLMTIADTTHLVVLVQVPANQAPLVTVNSPVRITAAAIPGKAIESKVAYIAPQIDHDTRTIQVRVPIAGDAGLAAGTFVDVDISPAPKGSEKEITVIAVPRDALFTVGGGTVVFVADDDHLGTYSMRKVAAAPAMGSLVPIISGVNDDDEVVIHGGFVIKAEFGKAGAKDED